MALPLFLLTGCFTQTYESGVRALCEAPLDPRMKAEPGLVTLQLVIEERVTNPEALALADQIAAPGSKQAVERLRADAAAVGLDTCALLQDQAAPVDAPAPQGLTTTADPVNPPPPPPPPLP